MHFARRQQYLEAIGIDLWVRRSPGQGTEAPAAPAKEPDDAPEQWQRLLAEVRDCRLCPLHATRTQGVLGVGPKRAAWLVIGEASRAEEDRRGEPFGGHAGQL